MRPTPRHFPEALAGRYRVLRRLGAGAMGAVFLVEDREVGDRQVAVKVTALHGRLAEELRARFLREARALAGLEHPAVLRVYDVGEADGLAYLVTEYLEGSSLEREIPDLDAVGAMLQVAEGLDAVHAEGLVHRDLKPANVFYTTGGRAVLLDFGLVLDPEAATITGTGKAVGTPATMAPEVLRGEPATPASDWYSWGATLYMVLEREPLRTEADLYALLAGEPVALPDFRAAADDPVARKLVEAALVLDPDPRVEAVRAIRARIDPSRSTRELPVLQGEDAGSAQVGAGGQRSSWALLRWVGAAALFAGGLWLGLPGTPGPTTAPTPRPPPSQDEVHEGALSADVAALEAGLEAVLRKVPEAQDPARWERIVARLPALSRLWTRDVAGMPGLEAGLRSRLRLLDARFASADLPRPFLMEESSVAAPSVDYKQRFWGASQLPDWVAGAPPEVEGLATPLYRLHVLRAAVEEDLDRIVATGEDPKRLIPQVVPITPLAASGARNLLRMALAKPETRRVAARWVRPGAEEVRRALLGATRVMPLLADHEREAVTFVFRWILGAESIWFAGELAVWPLDGLLPALPDDGPGAGLRAVVLNLKRPIRRRMGLDWRSTAQAGVSWGMAALETEPAAPARVAGWAWRRNVLVDVLQGLVELDRGDEARALYLRERARLRVEDDQAFLMSLAEILSVVWQAAGDDAKDEVDWLLDRIRPRKASHEERLRRYLGWAIRTRQGRVPAEAGP